MQVKKALKSKDVKRIEDIIEKNYGCRIDLGKYNVFLTSEDKVWLLSKKVNLKTFGNMKRIYSFGCYFGKLKRGDKIKLTIEGAILVGKCANKNVVILDEEEANKFVSGGHVIYSKEISCDLNNFVIVKFDDDVIGTGLFRGEFIENLIPKSRRIVLNI
ncbi:MAG: hypothetical protein J7L45_01755 [Candidatus Aenigmarchaeota archaeon]|nr:hypothetical protein [Candidatus Aenigmarchaeota archaeon]